MSSRLSHRETEAEFDRESVATTPFSSQSRRKRDRELNFVHALRDRDYLAKTLERKVDLAIQGVKWLSKNCSMPEIKAKIWEKRNRNHSFQEINQEFESQRFRLNQASQWADQAQREREREKKTACMENWT